MEDKNVNATNVTEQEIAGTVSPNGNTVTMETKESLWKKVCARGSKVKKAAWENRGKIGIAVGTGVVIGGKLLFEFAKVISKKNNTSEPQVEFSTSVPMPEPPEEEELEEFVEEEVTA